MNLKNSVEIARRFQRAIRIDSDLTDPKALDGYICPQSAVDTLLSMGHQVSETGQGAFTWTGPYGSGKSSLVVILSALLGPSKKVREQAREIVGDKLAGTLWDLLPPKKEGWNVIPVIGSRQDAIQVIAEALIAQNLPLKKPFSSRKVIDTLVSKAQSDPKSNGGTILFIDEMGKFLEGAAQEGNDIFFFQELAEAASRTNGRLIVVGILHQSFEEYANRLSREMREEWSKIQGRFIDLPINIAGEEQIELLSRAVISKRVPKEHSATAKEIANIIKSYRPGVSKELSGLLAGCWPLHPSVACLLGPISKRRFGQNQRSIFGFLNSAEPYGFQDFIKHAQDDDSYTLDKLWDYLRANLEPSILASPDSHRWAQAVDAVERCEAKSTDILHSLVAKNIALLDLFKDASGLIPSIETLKACFPDISEKKLKDVLQDLSKWSIIIFKKYIGSYAVYAGSDFDIEQALAEALYDIQEVDFKTLKKLTQLSPILAKRHYHNTGALRWFDLGITSVSSLEEVVKAYVPMGGSMGKFILAIPTEGESLEQAQKVCREAARASEEWDIAVGLSQRNWIITNLARELLALHHIRQEKSELSGDAVARKEVDARIAYTSSQLEKELHNAFNSATWYLKFYSDQKVTYFELNQLASELADKRYSKAPRIHNELLNRIKPSSNAVAAQKALMRQMVQYEGQSRLKIEGFPAEGGLFASLLESTGLYKEEEGTWQFVPPGTHYRQDPARLLPLWQVAQEHLDEHKARTVSVQEIYDIWTAPPYGVREGLLPVLIVTFLLSQRKRLAFYRDGNFQARFTDLEIDYLTNDPSSIQFRWMDISGLTSKILTGMAELAKDLSPDLCFQNEEPIDIARNLIAVFDGLHPWTHRSMRLSPSTIKIRDLFKHASDPNKFLFDDIPSLFGNGTDIDNPEIVQAIIKQLREGLNELLDAYPAMLHALKDQMLSELQVREISSDALAELQDRAKNIQQVGGDFRLDAFITRISNFTGSIEDMEGIASLATNKPPRDWVDRDLDLAAVEIMDLAQKFNRLESFARVKGRPDKRHAMAVVVGLKGIPTPLLEEFDVTESERGAVDNVVSAVEEALTGSNEKQRNIILAALAELSARYMKQQGEASTPRNGKKREVVAK